MLDNFSTQQITWNKANNRVYSPIKANSGDTNGRTLEVQILNGGTVEDLTGKSVNLAWRTKDGAFNGLDVFEAVDATKGIFKIKYTTGMLSNVGMLSASIVIIGTNERIESSSFVIIVERSNVNDASVQSENSFTTLTAALVRVEGLEGSYAPRLDSLDAQLAQTKNQIATVTNNPNNYDGPIVCIIDDDIRNEVKTIWQPVLTATGVKITFACITGLVGTSGYMTLPEIRALQDDGHEIVSHTVNHQATNDITVASAETEYSQSKQWLIDNGFKGYDTLVYPGGMPFNRVEIKNVARKHYRYAVATNYESGVINGTFDSWRVPRVQGDTSTLTQLKGDLDKAIANKSLMLIMTHSHVLGADGATKMQAFIEHVQGLNIPIMTYGDAMKVKGNAIAVGEYSNPASTFVSVEGKSKLGSGYIVLKGVMGELEKPITDYPMNAKSARILNSIADTFQNKGGVYEVFRSAEGDLYSYATFRTWDSHTVWERKWDLTNGIWRAWVPLARQTYDVGFWTPVLRGITTAGSHTYGTQFGSFTKVGNMVTARFNINIPAANLDASMAGNLEIAGLPFTSANTSVVARTMFDYNIFDLGAGYTIPMAGVNANQNVVTLYRIGNNVATNFLNRTAIPSGQTVILRGDITYQTP